MFTLFNSGILNTNRDAELVNSFVLMNLDNHDSCSSSETTEKKCEPIIEIKIPELIVQAEAEMIEDYIENEKYLEEKKENAIKHNISLSLLPPSKPKKLSAKEIHQELKKKRKKRKTRTIRQEEYFTDKDRAAAAVMGSKDIKVSLRIKKKQERSKALCIPEEAEPHNFIALGNHKFKSGNLKLAMEFYNKALELNPQEKNALVARSQCYILLGNPTEALKDAETALLIDKNNTKALYQKAEALYYLGEFEHSLVYYHRGLRTRPDLEKFKLGVNKAQKAIENAVGASLLKKVPSVVNSPKESKPTTKVASTKLSKSSTRLKTVPKQLCVEMKYLDNLLKHPDIKSKVPSESDVSQTIKEAVDYLQTRKEFWKQQLPP